jgi:hypothetical protein
MELAGTLSEPGSANKVAAPHLKAIDHSGERVSSRPQEASLPYRALTNAPAGTGDLVTFRRYLDPLAAQLDRTRLSAEGIEAHVIEAASYNPMLGGIGGGTRLQVREGDLTRVETLLHEHPDEAPRDDGEAAGTVRCPRCELAYCFHERLRVEGSSAASVVAFFLSPLLLLFVPKRWHCHKCGHVWSDPEEGPAAMTQLDADDAHPIFRLRRAHAGMGLFIGLMAGVTGALAVRAALPGEAGGLASILLYAGGPLLGWLIGRSLRYDVCSEARCRTALTPDREDCPRCKGAVAGVIRSADEHHAAAAEYRRELAALRAKDQEPRRKQKKKLPRGPSPTVAR